MLHAFAERIGRELQLACLLSPFRLMGGTRGLGIAARRAGLGLEPCFRDRRILEDLHGLRHPADLVLSVEIGDRDRAIATRELAHRLADARHRRRDHPVEPPAGDQRRDREDRSAEELARLMTRSAWFAARSCSSAAASTFLSAASSAARKLFCKSLAAGARATATAAS